MAEKDFGPFKQFVESQEDFGNADLPHFLGNHDLIFFEIVVTMTALSFLFSVFRTRGLRSESSQPSLSCVCPYTLSVTWPRA